MEELNFIVFNIQSPISPRSFFKDILLKINSYKKVLYIVSAFFFASQYIALMDLVDKNTTCVALCDCTVFNVLSQKTKKLLSSNHRCGL